VNNSHSAKGSRFIFLLAFIIGAQPMATDLYLPAMPDLAKGLADWSIKGLSFSSTSSLTFFTLFYGLGQVAGGQWVDRYGRRASLLASLAVYVLSGMGCTYASNMAWLLALRSMQGLATATIVVSARAALRDTYSVEEAPRMMAQLFIRMGVIVVLCPLLGGWIASHGGWRVSLGVMTAYGAALWTWVYWQFPETRPSMVQPSTMHRAAADLPVPLTALALLHTVWQSASFRLWTLVASFTIAGVFTFLTITSHLFIGYLGWTASHYSWALMGAAVVFVLSNLLCNQLLKHYTKMTIAKLGAGLSLAGGIALCAVSWAFGQAHIGQSHSAMPLALLLSHYVFQLGHGMLQSCAMTGAVEDFPHMAGRAAAWSGLIMMVVAFAVSQTAASFVNVQHTNGVWPWAISIFVCGGTLAVLVAKMKSTMRI
jgi:DHA1 family bicyclomycin/chloramphenicol resistance-like MFS transporter